MSESLASTHPSLIVESECGHDFSNLEIKTDKIVEILQDGGLTPEEIEATTIYIGKETPKGQAIGGRYKCPQKLIEIYVAPAARWAQERERTAALNPWLPSRQFEALSELLPGHRIQIRGQAKRRLAESTEIFIKGLKHKHIDEGASYLVSMALRGYLEERIMHFEGYYDQAEVKRKRFLKVASKTIAYGTLANAFAYLLYKYEYISETFLSFSSIPVNGILAASVAAREIQFRIRKQKDYAKLADLERVMKAEKDVQWNDPLIVAQLKSNI